MSNTTSQPPPASKPVTEEIMTEEEKAIIREAEQDIMTEEEKALHLTFMREALAMVPFLSFFPSFKPKTKIPQAEHALNTNETPVGCVFVHQGSIIGRGMNATNRSYNGTRHAEFMAISSILSEPAESGQEDETRRRKRKYGQEVLRECDLYVTVEPCIMCASLLRQFGVRKVFYGASNEKFGGTGGVLNIHRANGRDLGDGKVDTMVEEGDYEVSGGWLRDEAVHMLQRFYMQENERAPEPKARGKKGVVLAGAEVEVQDGKVGNG